MTTCFIRRFDTQENKTRSSKEPSDMIKETFIIIDLFRFIKVRQGEWEDVNQGKCES